MLPISGWLGHSGAVNVAAHQMLTRAHHKRKAIEDAQSYQRTDYKRPRTEAPTKEAKSMVRARPRFARLSRRKRFRRRRPYRRVPRSVQPFSVLRTMKTVTYGSLNPGAGTLTAGTFNLNSGFDPTGAAGSGQPLGWDQMTALYNKYCVISWSVKIEFCTTDNAAATATVVGFTPTTQSSALTTFAHYKELPGTVSAITTPDKDRITLFARGGVKKYFLPPGGKLLSNENLSAAIGGSPTNVLYGHYWAQSMDGAADPAVCNFIVTMWQKIVFFDPVIPARS